MYFTDHLLYIELQSLSNHMLLNNMILTYNILHVLMDIDVASIFNTNRNNGRGHG